MRRSNRLSVATVLPALLLGAMLGGCSDIYLDRREGVTFYGGDAAATNVAIHTIDPWPPAASNRHLETNGERMQKAAERYRTNKVTPIQPIGTSSVQLNSAAAAAAPAAGSTPGSP
jgi:hypothetical protein